MAASHEKLISVLRLKGISDPKVIQAMEEVDRADFVTNDMKRLAYEDRPLSIGFDQVISQPYLVAYMAQALKLKPDDVVFEVGTGSGYHAAIISRLVSQVYSVEIIRPLAEWGKRNLEKAGIGNVAVLHGDGYEGLPDKAPFDAILFTAAPPVIPQPLRQQLKTGGRLIIPMGDMYQYLELHEKTGEDKFKVQRLIGVRFVPMTGKAQIYENE